MPIQVDTVKMTFNFRYVSEDEKTSYFVRFHHVDGQAVVSLSENEDNWYDMPASLFTDVSDFLRKERVMDGGAAPVVKPRSAILPGTPRQLPSAGKTLPLPTSGESIEDVLDSNELESLSGLEDIESIVSPATGSNIVEDASFINRPVKKSGFDMPANEEKTIKRK